MLGKIIKWSESVIDEGKEEVLQKITTNATAKMLYDFDAPVFSMTDETAIVNPPELAKDFAMGAARCRVVGRVANRSC